MSTVPLALQLYTVRADTAHDFAGTLRRVAGIGYGAVEFAGYGGLAADEMNMLLAETGLRAASTHVGLAVLDDDLAGAIDYCLAIGSSFLVLPFLPPEWRGVDAPARLAPRLNEIGARCHERGITFAYHNHDFEFAPGEDGYLLDRLLDSTDPALVGLEFDVYWAAYAGVDPVAYIQRRRGRIPLVHLKDVSADRSFTEVGDGTLDIPAICTAARAAGAHWFIVENDQPRGPALESARRSLGNLTAMGLAGR